MRTVRSLSMVIAYLAFVAPAAAQPVADHLECFKVTDKSRLAYYTADLNGFVLQAGCKIRVPAALICVPSTKTNVAPTPPGDNVEGAPTDGIACYSVRCPRVPLPGIVIEDQFGTRNATPLVARMVCGPLRPTVVPTSTSTTTTSTTSTTTPQTAATRCAARGGTFSTTGPILTGDMFGRTLIWVCNDAAPPTGDDDLTLQCFDDASALGWTQTLVSYAYTNNPRIDYTCGAIPPA